MKLEAKARLQAARGLDHRPKPLPKFKPNTMAWWFWNGVGHKQPGYEELKVAAVLVVSQTSTNYLLETRPGNGKRKYPISEPNMYLVAMDQFKSRSELEAYAKKLAALYVKDHIAEIKYGVKAYGHNAESAAERVTQYENAKPKIIVESGGFDLPY